MKFSLINSLALTAFGLALGGPVVAIAQGRPVPNTVLFVGNSFFHGKYLPVLHYNTAAVKDENFGLPKDSPRFESVESEPGPWGGIPAIFKKMTDEAGLRYEVHLETISGKTLQYHYENALAVIQQSRWNTVVLQENSSWALPARRNGHPEAFREYATKLEQAVHTASPTARVYLYQTWARADLYYPPNATYAGQPLDSMTHDLHAAYYGLAQQDPRIAGVAPAGDAWLRAIQTGVALPNPYAPEAGKMDLWAEDHYHPSNRGSYLNACVLFGEITNHDPRRLGGAEQAAATLGLTPTEAVALQRIAYEQVLAARPTAFAKKAGPKEQRRKGKSNPKS